MVIKKTVPIIYAYTVHNKIHFSALERGLLEFLSFYYRHSDPLAEILFKIDKFYYVFKFI